jgi:predicted esterase
MPAQHRTLQVPRTAHLHQLGTLRSQTQDVWIVLHGYGQLARYFVRHFEVLANEQTVVIAPEALSRFYLERVSGRVGASWMTKEERLHEITDYVTYLNLVSDLVQQEAPAARLHILAFSQGAATACRWVAQAQVPVAELVLWAGIFPEDMEIASARQNLSAPRLTYVYGLQDPYIADGKVHEQLTRVREAGLELEVISFEGKHEINAEVLRQLQARPNK